MKTLSVKIPESLAKWLVGEARQTRRSRSAIVREVLESRSSGQGRGKKKEVTMAEALDSLGGTFRGPRDLSTNPKHLEGLGQ